MKRFMPALLFSMLSLLPLPALAQAKSPDKPSIPVKVLIVFSEYNGEKRISSMPYSFVVIADEKIRMSFLGLDQRFRLSVTKFKPAQVEVCPVCCGTPVQETSVVELSESVSKPSFPVYLHVHTSGNINHIEEMRKISHKI